MEPSVEAVEKLTNLIEGAGVAAVLIAVLIVVFLGIMSVFLNRYLSNAKTKDENFSTLMKEMTDQNAKMNNLFLDFIKEQSKQNNLLVTTLISKSSTDKKQSTDYEKLFKIYTTTTKTLKERAQIVALSSKADRVGIYTFHNNTSSLSGFHYVKMTCVEEVGLIKRILTQKDISASALTDISEKLFETGEFIVEDISLLKDTHANLYHWLESFNSKSYIFRCIYSSSDNVIGFVMVEYKDGFPDVMNHKNVMFDVIELAHNTAPLLDLNLLNH